MGIREIARGTRITDENRRRGEQKGGKGHRINAEWRGRSNQIPGGTKLDLLISQ
jgi:hypothetical protein